MTIGVLALQGSFMPHLAVLKGLGVPCAPVRRSDELRGCAGLILPGGESTTLIRQLEFIHLLEPLRVFAQSKPCFGTCAGLILLSDTQIDARHKGLAILDVTVERNAYGSQIDSFSETISVEGQSIHAIFIRAPKILRCGSAVELLATHSGVPVLVRQGHHLGATFHPELSGNPSIHRVFVKNCAP